jgi:hypothetical protein
MAAVGGGTWRLGMLDRFVLGIELVYVCDDILCPEFDGKRGCGKRRLG